MSSKMPPQRPVLFNATPESIRDGAEEIIRQTWSVWNGIVSDVSPETATFQNTITPIIQDENAKSERQRVLRFYASTSSSKELRDASNAATKRFNDAEVDLFLRRDMFVLVDAVLRMSQGTESSLDKEDMHYLKTLHRRFYQNGCGISDDTQRVNFAAKRKRLDDLVHECNKNLHEETTGLWLTSDDLHGVPKGTIARLKIGEGDNEGKLWLPTKVPFTSPTMANATSEETRQRVYSAVQNRMMANVPLFRELVLLRDETARMLGYPNHLASKTSEKMVQSPYAVIKLLNKVRDAIAPLAAQDAAELLVLKKAETKADKLFLWDIAYYEKKKKDGGRTLDTISQYFELGRTTDKMLQTFEHLFGTRFQRITPHDPDIGHPALYWHEDVQMFAVWDTDAATNNFLGYAYLDMFPRDGKYTHIGHYSLQQGYAKTDGTRFYPSSVLVMNYMKPTEDKPTLLSLEEARKLFHELGHLLHSLSTRVKHAGLHAVDRDFVEAPSMMLEHFLWDPVHIKELSYHYSYINPTMERAWGATQQAGTAIQPPLQLDDEQVTLLVNTSRQKVRAEQRKELFFATYDMLIHNPSSHEELENINLTALFNQTRTDIYQVHGGEALGQGWEWAHGQAAFRNVINGYDAGFYGYILGRVFALDLFATGFHGSTRSKEAGRKYRQMVLSVGGSQPEMETLTEYLGHRPSLRPYLEWLGADADSVDVSI